MTIARTVCLGFLALILIGTILLILPFATNDGSWNNPMVALFTSTSAVCVTGLAVVDTGTYFSFWGQLTILFLIQLGGFGYMMTTTFLMLLLGRKFDLKQKFAIKESFDRPFLQGSNSLVVSIVATTLFFEITGIFLLLKVFAQEYGLSRGLWLSIFHSISAWNNAGFSLFSDSLVAYKSSWLVNLVIPGLVIFGGIGYQVIIEFYLWLRKNISRQKRVFCFSLNFKVVISTTILLLIVGTFAFFLTEFNNPATLRNLSLQDKFLTAWFQSMTTRTAGFNSIDIGKMTTAGLFITMGFMFIGASPSGTGGGIKTTTFRILLNCTKSALQGKDDVVLYQREVPSTLILKAIAVVFGTAASIVVVTILISLVEPNLVFIQIFFEVISAFATVGLSTGITASLHSTAQLILICAMYIGRVSILLLIAAFIGNVKPTSLHYPEENLLVG
ncbi:Potassium uptake protein, TrkH family [Hyella patelloides LEGE 07179]|uniref:Potassium uptake protein, TrkH family n=1 Tax=Hyella patelloides LEGE 07179 TaxID=945734 RepID=A0A563VY63_9CYAN|nr:TrkH family potassium uptake protein [Hyella patelloides]VEP16345.1 Potassium uptake protein, TrkH family [Hyella patelloides LEGE 07179]